jgi:hypothetical protein
MPLTLFVVITEDPEALSDAMPGGTSWSSVDVSEAELLIPNISATQLAVPAFVAAVEHRKRAKAAIRKT